MKKFFLLLLTTVGFSLTLSAEAIVTETKVLQATYEYSDPSPVADLWAPSKPIYPYYRFDGFTSKAIEKQWKVVVLENDYIKVTIYPEVGGKIWGAIDKATGKEFIYNNDAVKFRDIAMRGPWTSGGIEFNFGIIGHVPTTATPVDYCTRTNADNSVSCFVSAYEWITGTWWQVEINLPADKAYFSTNVTWHNSSSIEQPYYNWMNAGYAALGNTEFSLKCDHVINHYGTWETYPVFSRGGTPEGDSAGIHTEEALAGKDYSWYDKSNWGASKSWHAVGAYSPFYAVYWHDLDFGSGHYAPYTDKFGRKIFMWAHSRQGGIWEDLLTDKHGQYIELQAGRMFCQPLHGVTYTPFKNTAFSPEQTDVWNEYWYPIRDTKGVVESSPIGTLNLIKGNTQTEILFSPLQKLSTTLKVYSNKKLLKTYSLNTEVLKLWTARIDNNLLNNADIKVVIGQNELVYSSNIKDILTNRPVEMPADFNWESAYGYYVVGEQYLLQKMHQEAEEYLKNALAIDKYYLPAIQTLASLYYRQGKYEEALDLCETAIAINTYDGKSNYLYGLCNQVLNKYLQAKDGFSMAARDIAYRSASYEHLAEIAITEKEYTEANIYANRAVKDDPTNITAQQVLLVSNRLLNIDNSAILNKQLISYPLHHGLRYEAMLANMISKGEFTSHIRTEMIHEVYIELADFYAKLGLDDNAIELLANTSYPIAQYMIAYLQRDVAKLSTINELSADFVFPYRNSTLNILKWAEENMPSWKTRYYMALILWSNQQVEKARILLDKCDDANWAPLYLTRATMKQGEKQLNDILRSQKLNDSWRVGRALVTYYNESKQYENAVKDGSKYMRKYPTNYYIGVPYAKALYESGEYQMCQKFLSSISILPFEGATEGHDIYRAACLRYAEQLIAKKQYKEAQKQIELAKLWPENLGVGKPYDDLIDYTRENELTNIINRALNK